MATLSLTSGDLIGDRRLLDAACRTDLVTFTGKCFHTLAPNSVFFPNWHICAMAHYAEEIRLGRLLRLVVSVPPRSLKSVLYSVALPAFILGHDPTKRVIVVSYGQDLSIKHGNDCRAIVNSSWYPRLFPEMRVSRAKNTEAEVVTTRNGYRLATSVDGTLTGRGGDVIIVDDPLKPIDALSDSKRERVNEWYNHTLVSRLDDKRRGAIIVVAQRLHMDDLPGVLLRDPEWTPLILPAIAEVDEQIAIGNNRFHQRRAGDVLHPEREPMSVLESIRNQLGSDTFAAQYLQAPLPPGGAMIKRAWVCRYEQLPTVPNRFVIQSWDAANKEGGQNDWSVCTTWLVSANNYYLVDVLRGRFDYPTLKARLIEHAHQHRPSRILIEDAGVGTALIQELRHSPFSVIAVKPQRDKLTRMSVQSGKFQSRRVWFPYQAPWLPELEAEAFAFPGCRYDDQIDSISQALGYEIPGLWDRNSLANYGKMIDGLAMDSYFGLLSGRPW